MFEKVNPYHPDKVADRIAGAVVDLCYARTEGGIKSGNPRVAVEVLVGHGTATVIIETSLGRRELTAADVVDIVRRLCPDISTEQMHIMIAEQDRHLAQNQSRGLRCGDNGIFRGVPVTEEQELLSDFVRYLAERQPTDGKFLVGPMDGVRTEDGTLYKCQFPSSVALCCQSNMASEDVTRAFKEFCRERDLLDEHGIPMWDDKPTIPICNPLGDWTGGTDVDCGATNRKLGSDMGDAVTGGGLHGKSLEKADVSVNIVCHELAQLYGTVVTACCAIGDEAVVFRFANGREDCPMPFHMVVEQAADYILDKHGSFERFAEWGLI